MTQRTPAATSRHTHDPGHHGHGTRGGDALRWALLLTLGFALVEVAGGLWAGSLALLSDAGHMFSDSVALALAAFAAWIARRPPSTRHSYGFMRAETMVALLNSLILLGVVVGIVVEAIRRLQAPQPVAGGVVMVIAFIGLLVNLGAGLVLSQGERTLNIRGALLHVMGDLLGSVAALISGAVIYFTGWIRIDPILSLLVAALILFSTLNLLREALHVLMEGVPPGLALEQVGRHMARVAGVEAVHDLHIWTLSSGLIALSAHLEIRDLNTWPRILEAMRRMLHEQFDIDHVTLQPEVVPWVDSPYRVAIPINTPSHPAARRSRTKPFRSRSDS